MYSNEAADTRRRSALDADAAVLSLQDARGGEQTMTHDGGAGAGQRGHRPTPTVDWAFVHAIKSVAARKPCGRFALEHPVGCNNNSGGGVSMCSGMLARKRPCSGEISLLQCAKSGERSGGGGAVGVEPRVFRSAPAMGTARHSQARARARARSQMYSNVNPNMFSISSEERARVRVVCCVIAQHTCARQCWMCTRFR